MQTLLLVHHPICISSKSASSKQHFPKPLSSISRKNSFPSFTSLPLNHLRNLRVGNLALTEVLCNICARRSEQGNRVGKESKLRCRRVRNSCPILNSCPVPPSAPPLHPLSPSTFGIFFSHSSALALFQKLAGRIILGSQRCLYFWTTSVTSSKRPSSRVRGERPRLQNLRLDTSSWQREGRGRFS